MVAALARRGCAGRQPLVLAALVGTAVLAVSLAAPGGLPSTGPELLEPLFWPQPKQIELLPGKVSQLQPQTFAFRLGQVPANDDLRAILQRALGRYKSLIFWSASTPRSVKELQRTRSAADKAEKALGLPQLQSLTISIESDSVALNIDTDESYTLRIAAHASGFDAPLSELRAKTVFGAIRGLETFSQWVNRVGEETDPDAYFVCDGEISDAPRFPFRGLHIDTSRHFLPLDLIRANLDAMAYNKLNVMHWHMTDDESQPYRSEVLPKFADGAFTPLHTYTLAEVRSIVAFARDRGIRVVPEFDTPGHVRSWGVGYPELLTECSAEFTHHAPLNPVKNSTYEFMGKLLDEMATVFPDDWVHNGGDEVWFGKDCWADNAGIRAFMAERGMRSFAELESYYNTRLVKMVEARGKTAMVWQEVFDNRPADLPKNTIVDVWKGGGDNPLDLDHVLKQGFRAVWSSPFYLDHVNKHFQEFYRHSLLNIPGLAQEQKNLLGVKACMWAEHCDASNWMQRAWPRAAALAERAWSPAEDPLYRVDGRRQSYAVDASLRSSSKASINGRQSASVANDIGLSDDVYERSMDMHCRLHRRGVRPAPIDRGYCVPMKTFGYKPPYGEQDEE